MKRPIATVSLISVAMAFAGPLHASHDRPLTGEEIKELLDGAVMAGVTSRGARDYTVHYRANGTAEFLMPHNNKRDSGKWTVQGHQYCRQWNWLDQGRHRCFNMYHEGGDTYIWENPENREQTKGNLIDRRKD